MKWKRISKGELPPKDKEVLAAIVYDGNIRFRTCYGVELLVGRKIDEFNHVAHWRDLWCEIPVPDCFRWSKRLNTYIDLGDRK